MTLSKVLFTSNRQDWETPQWLFDKLNKHFNFTLDACATKENAKCESYITPNIDGLKVDWGDVYSVYKFGDFDYIPNVVFCNPPYNELYKWVKKGYEESLKGCTVVMLIPARTDTKVFHEYVCKGRVTLLKGRLKFSDAEYPAPFPSCIVVFGKQYDASIRNQADDFLFKE